jgi:mRNA interferase YafQ
MLILRRHKQYVKEYDKIKLSDKHYSRYVLFLSKLISQEKLPQEARDHQLKGNYSDCSEFHISGDYLVVYRIEEGILQLLRIGSHSELFS